MIRFAPPEGPGRVTPGSAGPVSRLLGTIALIVFASVLIAAVTMTPSKRNIEVLAAVVFLAIVLVAHPRKALYFTLIVVPFPAYTTVGSTSSLLIMALAGLVLVKSKELVLPSPFSDRKVDVPLIGFVLVLLIAIYQVPTEWMFRALPKTLGMLSAIALFYIIVQLTQTRAQLFTLIKVVAASAMSLYLIAFLQSLFPTKTILPAFFKFSQRVASMEQIRAGEIRVFATFPGFETFAEHIVLSLCLQYLLWRLSRSMTQRAFYLVAMFLALAVLFATGTRSGIIILGLAWLTLTVLSRDIIPRKDLFQILFLGMALFYLALPFAGDYLSMMLERLSLLVDADSKHVTTLNSRTYVWAEAWEGIQERPLTGHGFYDYSGMWSGPIAMHVHNLYLTIAYMLGLPGLALFLTFLGSIALNAYRTMRDRRVSKDIRATLLICFTMLVVFVIDQGKIEFVRQALTMHTTFIFFAITVAATRVAKNELLE
jgi:O-antigen ligase